MSIYKDQSLLTIILETGLSLTTATDPKILYKKPDGTTGFFTATIARTKLTYDVQNGDLDQTGVWQLQASVQIGERTGLGDITKIKVEPSL